MASEDERERAAVYMDGMAQMRSDWARERPPKKRKKHAGTKRILVPTDFSEASGAATTYGIAMARAFNAQICLLHVEPRHDLEIMVERELVVEKYLSEAAPARSQSNAAHELLAKLLSDDDQRDLRAEYVLRASGAGGPSAEIVRLRRRARHRLDCHGDAWPRLRRSCVDGQRRRACGPQGAVSSADSSQPPASGAASLKTRKGLFPGKEALSHSATAGFLCPR